MPVRIERKDPARGAGAGFVRVGKVLDACKRVVGIAVCLVRGVGPLHDVGVALRGDVPQVDAGRLGCLDRYDVRLGVELVAGGGDELLHVVLAGGHVAMAEWPSPSRWNSPYLSVQARSR